MPDPAVDELRRQVTAALDGVIDPCSVGRGVPAGMPDMGLVCGVDVTGGSQARSDVRVTLRLTAPGCTFQMYFDQQARTRLQELPGVGDVELVWSDRFDWSDEDLSDDLKRRLRAKRQLTLNERRDPPRAVTV